MVSKLKRPIAFMAAVAMMLTMLMYLPSSIISDIGWGLKASAATAITPSQPTGDGSVGSPYQIGTAAELYWFAGLVNGTLDGVTQNTAAHAKLTANITVNNNVLVDGALNTTNSGSFTSWTPIGNYDNQYTGTFDGNGKTISGLYFDDGNTWYVGLFGYVGSGGNVSNVGIVDSYFNGKYHVGGVCGINDGGTIQNCYNTGAVSGSYGIGGVCGDNLKRKNILKSTIENCYNTGKVEAKESNVGGVCGYNDGGTITNCYFDSDHYDGGAVGYTYGGTITNVDGKTTNAFKQGEVCYLLQGGQENDSESGKAPMVWGQTIGIDKAPVLTSDSKKTVYLIGGTYSNTNSEITEEAHDFGADFKCKNCGNYEEPELNENVYEITNASQLYWFAEYVNNGNTSAKAILKENIDVNANVLDEAGNLVSDTNNFVSWTPIGNSLKQYTGTFNGNGKTISGLYFDNNGTDYVGLFGNVGSSGNVSNVGVVASYFKGKNNVGGVCGNNNGTIKNCYNTGAVNGSENVGGVSGYSGGGTIQNCYNTGAVSGSKYVGGVCGYNEGGTITNCYFDSDNYGGDAVGYTYGGTITDVEGKTTNAFEKGEVCYLLQGGQENDSESGKAPMVWGQTIDTDKAPVLTSDSAKTVYRKTTGCATYSNTKSEITEKAHSNFGADFRCTDCGKYETPELNENIYEITNASQLYWFAEYVKNGNTSAKAILKENIVVNENVLGADGKLVSDTSKFVSWTPIGSMSNNYTGTFDGNGKTISGLYFDDGNTKYVGLFGYVKSGGNVSNVGVVASYFNGSDDVGGVCGYNEGGTIENCYNTGAVSGSDDVGGVCGFNEGGTIENCYNTGAVSGSDDVGGVCGFNDGGTIENCYNTGAVNGSNKVGGVCGFNYGTIKNCYNTGAVSGNNHVGGVCGYNNDGGTITNCYNTGAVSGSDDVGGVCGSNSGGTIKNCNSTGEVSGGSSVGGVCGDNYYGKITDSYNTGSVSGSNKVGDVCGYNNGGTITNCYNTGKVSGGSSVGGVCGANYLGTITNCYYDSTVFSGIAVGSNMSGTVTDVEGKATAQFNSGEVAYLLQSGQTADENGTIPEVWGQEIGTENYPVLGGDKVYKTTPCVSYSNTEIKEHTDANDDGYCDNCGIIIDGIGAKLIGHSITLDGSIGVYFYMELSDEVIADNKAYMEFTLPNGKTSCVNVSSAETEELSGKTYYKFRCDVNAGEMTDKIKAQLKSTVGESKVYEYTVKEYADYILEHKDENQEFAKASELIEAMLNYGSYAQIYANYNADNLAVGSEENLKNVDSVSINEYTYTPNENETNVKLAGANLSLLSRTTLRLFFTIENVDAENVTFTYGGNTLEKTKSGDYYYVEIAGISASMLDDNCVVNVNDGTNTFDVTYTPMAYCTSVVTRPTTETRTESLKNLIKALALYNQAADAYINQ